MVETMNKDGNGSSTKSDDQWPDSLSSIRLMSLLMPMLVMFVKIVQV
jgi:hypothetical protein